MTKRHQRVQDEHQARVERPQEPVASGRSRVILARTEKQALHLAHLQTKDCVFATGPAGTGKTFVMAAYAAMAIRDRMVEEIVVTRPTVEAGASKLGFLKGGMKEKFEPWLWPYLKGLDFILGPGHREYLLEKERIKAVPLQYMQGTSFDNSIVLADEFENATLAELKMLLTRTGDNTRVFIAGDIDQAMTRDSGLSEAIAILKHSVPGVAHVEYQTSDCVRSEFTRRVLEAFAGVDYQSRGDYNA